MINGAHIIIYSKDAEADRAFFRDVLHLSNVDAGDGWLIFGLPPSEVAVHPSEDDGRHEFFLMCENLETLMAKMKELAIEASPAQDMGWGVLTKITLPGGGGLGVYEPRHARP